MSDAHSKRVFNFRKFTSCSNTRPSLCMRTNRKTVHRAPFHHVPRPNHRETTGRVIKRLYYSPGEISPCDGRVAKTFIRCYIRQVNAVNGGDIVMLDSVRRSVNSSIFPHKNTPVTPQPSLSMTSLSLAGDASTEQVHY